jgi:predicted ATPase
MLTYLHVENFKAWKTLDVKLGRVTGLFGTNSSGKSSLLQFLLMLKQTKNATDRGVVLDFGGPGQLVNLGSYRDVVHGHDINKVLSWELQWSLPYQMKINDPAKKRTQVMAADSGLAVQSMARVDNGMLLSNYLAYQFSGFTFYLAPTRVGGSEFQLNVENPPDSDFNFVHSKELPRSIPGPIKTHLFPGQAKTHYQNAGFLGQFETAYEAMMDSVYYLGPLREHPRREYSWSGAKPSDVGLRGERTIEVILSATMRNETRNVRAHSPARPFQEAIAYWLKELGLIHEFRVEEIGASTNLYRTLVRHDVNSPESLLTDVGFGVSQVLPALVLLYYVPEGSTILMEQPEIHLHPSVQSGLADAILTVAKSRKLQVIVESHSEHLLRRFQRRVAENTFPADEIKLYFCDSVGGESKLVDLDIDLFGEIRNWPRDFFGDEMHEIAETRKAILKNKMRQVVA